MALKQIVRPPDKHFCLSVLDILYKKCYNPLQIVHNTEMRKKQSATPMQRVAGWCEAITGGLYTGLGVAFPNGNVSVGRTVPDR